MKITPTHTAINGISTFQSGTPLPLTDAVNLTNSFGGGSRPNSTGQSAQLSGAAQSRLNGWFNKAAFTVPPAFTFGNLARTVPDVRGPGINNFDFAVFKNFPIGEHKEIQFRWENYNFTNTPPFNPPTLEISSGTFGRITSAGLGREMQFALRLSF